MDLVAAVVADQQSLEVVQPSEGAFDDPAAAAETGAMFGLAAGDVGADAAPTQFAPVLVVVVATVGDHALGSLARSADLAAHLRHPLDERDELGDVVAVAAGNRPGEWDTGAVYEKVMLGTGSGSINRARPRRGAPFFACT